MHIMKMKRMMAALCCLLALTLWTGCSGDDEGDNNSRKPAATTLYRGSLELKSWADSTKIAVEMPGIEETFLQYLGVKSLKNFTVSEGDEATNDAAVVHQCQLAAAVLGKAEYDGDYKLTILKAESKDTLFVFRPTPANFGASRPLREYPSYPPAEGEDDMKYISEVAVAASASANGAQVELANHGFIVINNDLNAGLGGDYVYLGVKYTDDICDAITGFYIVVDARPGSFTKDGLKYNAVTAFGNNNGSLNSNTGGRNMWLYATKEGTSCVNWIDIVEDDNRMQADNLVKGLNSSLGRWDQYNGVDVNTGAGGSYRYIRIWFSGKSKPADAGLSELRAVDMGLSVKWASMNVGAEKVTDFGSFFAWAETKGYSSTNVNDGRDFSFNAYVGNSANYKIGGTTVLTAADDAATVNLGGKWRMPTREEVQELCDTRVSPAYSWEWKQNYGGVEGCYGYLITCRGNGNAIFLPAAGARIDNRIIERGKTGCYWSSTADDEPVEDFSDVTAEACKLVISHSAPYSDVNTDAFVYGFSVRAVQPY